MSTWAFYSDAGLTARLSALQLQLPDTGGTAETVVYFGSPEAGKTLVAASAPGVDAVAISPADADDQTGLDAAHLRLALSYPALAAATPGAGVDVGTTLVSGAGGAVAVFLQLTAGATPVGEYVDLSLQSSPVVEA